MTLHMRMLTAILAIGGANSLAFERSFMEPAFCPNKTTIWGSIQFPKNITTVPVIRVYYAGQRSIKCEVNHDLKRIIFSIPDEYPNTHYSLLITDQLDFCKNSVIKYLKIKDKAPYRFYELFLEGNDNSLCSLDQDQDNQPKAKKRWSIKETPHALHNNRIPDKAIIVCCNPQWISSLEGTGTTALPTIMIRKDVLKIAGSEKQLHEHSHELLLSLLDFDTIHAASRQEEVRPAASPKTVLTLTT